MNVSIEFLTHQLKSKDIRPSYQRLKVLDFMHKNGSHPTADEIFRALAADIPSLSKVTIYNTLHTFVEAGLVREVGIDGIEKHYDIMLTNHGHFQCESCGTIYDFKIDIDQVSMDGLSQFEITQKHVYFKGLCPVCIQQSNSKRKEKTNE